MIKRLKKAITFTLLSLLYINSFSAPVWMPSAVTISAAAGSQGTLSVPVCVEDGSGGAVFAWMDNRAGNIDIYAGRVDSNGNTAIAGWIADGVAVCTSAGAQQSIAACSDGSGGIIITWTDFRAANQDIYAQRISSSGAVMWQANGVTVCADSRGQSMPAIVSDGAGGAIILWQDGRNDGDLYAQRITAGGGAAWAANGTAVCSAAGNIAWHSAAAAPAGGLYAVWQDKRSDANGDVYAQYINASGATQWTADGIPVVAGAGFHTMSSSLAVDVSGNLSVPVLAGDRTILIQKIDQSGSLLYAPGGVTVTTSPVAYCSDVFCTASESGSVITIWTDDRSVAGNYRAYAQKTDSSGNKLWGADGILVSGLNEQLLPFKAVSDGAGGAVFGFYDSGSDTYLQRLDAPGVLQWGTDGLKTNSSSNFCMVSDGAGGVIAGWGGGAGNDMFSQRYSDGAITPTPTPTMTPVIAPGWVDIDGTGTESISVTNLMGVSNTVKIGLDSQSRPHLLFQQNPGTGQRIYYLKWNGSAWVDADGAGQESVLLTQSGTFSGSPSLVIDKNDLPHVSWLRTSIYYMRWNSSAWVDADGSGTESILAASTANYSMSKPVLKVDNTGTPQIAWVEYVLVLEGDPYYLKWNGSAWADADGSGQEAVAVSTTAGVNSDHINMELGPDGRPHIVWWENSTNKLQYLKWNGSEWVDADGTGRESGNVAVSTGSVIAPSIKVDASGEAHVSWYRGTAPTQLYYLRTLAGAWVDADGTGTESSRVLDYSNNLGATKIALDGQGRPHIVFSSVNGGDLDLCYLKWNGSAWTDIDGIGTESMVLYNSGGSAFAPDFVLDESGTAHIAWHDNESGQLRYLKYPGAGAAYPTPTPTMTHTASPTNTITPTMTQTQAATATHTFTATPTAVSCTAGKTSAAGVYSSHSAGYTAGSVFVFPSGTLSEIRLAMQSTVGTITAAIYDNSGANGTAGNLIASAGSVSASAGWNSIPITGTISVPGSYWIMIQYDGLNQFDNQSGVAGAGCFASVGAYGTWPAALSANGPTDQQVGVYAVMTGCGPTPGVTATFTTTATVTPTYSVTPSPTPTPLSTTEAAPCYFSSWPGGQGTASGQFDWPDDMAADQAGNIYIVDSLNDRIQKFDQNGNYLYEWGGTGGAAGQFEEPHGIAIDGAGFIYIADTYNYRIQKFDSSGQFITLWGSLGNGDGEFEEVYRIAADSEGNIYCADAFNNRVVKFDSSGIFLGYWGTYGSGNGQFSYINSIALSSDGYVYTAEKGNNRVQKFDYSGNYITQWPLPDNPALMYGNYWLSADGAGNVYVSNVYDSNIMLFSGTGTLKSVFGSYGAGPGEFGYPARVLERADGSVLVLDSENCNLHIYGDCAWLTASPTPSATFTATIIFTSTATVTVTATATATLPPAVTPVFTPTATPVSVNFELITSEDQAFTSPEPARIIMYFNYRLEMDADPIVIDVYNFAGKRVATVTERNVLAGIRRIEMNVERFAPGVYYYVISADYVNGDKVKFKPAKFMVAR